MNDEMNNWFFVCEAINVEVEDIVRFDHLDKTFCIYRLEIINTNSFYHSIIK